MSLVPLLDLSTPEAEPSSESPAMGEALRAARDGAPTPTTILLLGEPGTGRGRLARYVHARSGRTGPCAVLRCDDDRGRVAEALRGDLLAGAAGGTLILREVGALPLSAQPHLVRALQQRESRAGAPARIVATATGDLAAAVATGLFRSDLYYRLNVFSIAVPPLRERAEDLVPLAAALLEEAAGAHGRKAPALSDAALATLRAHPFPGNVSELREVLRRALTRARWEEIGPAHLALQPAAGAAAVPAFPGGLPLDLVELERLAIGEALRRVRGNRTQAARLLNIGLRTLRNKLKAWREAGDEVPPAPRPSPELPAPERPPASGTAAILARRWARRSQEDRA